MLFRSANAPTGITGALWINNSGALQIDNESTSLAPIIGSGAPSGSTGSYSQFYFDTTSSILYGPKLNQNGILITSGPVAKWSFFITDDTSDTNIRPVENGGVYPTESQYLKVVYSGSPPINGNLTIATSSGSGSDPHFGQYQNFEYSLLNNNSSGTGNITVSFDGNTVLAITLITGENTWPQVGGITGPTGNTGSTGPTGPRGYVSSTFYPTNGTPIIDGSNITIN